MNKKILIGAIVLILAIVGAYFYIYRSVITPESEQTPSKEILIGFSLGTLQEERWQRDRDEFLKRAGKLGVVVDVQSSDNDSAKQISQIEGMIVKGVDVLVVAPYDADSLTAVIEDAHKAGIKVISYDRLIRNADVDLYLSFDNEKVGEYEAKSVMDSVSDRLGSGTKLKVAYVGGAPTDNNAFLLKTGSFKVLQPEIDKGNIEIVMDKFSENWNPEAAYQNLKEYLDKNEGLIDAVVAANDGTAFGSIRALEEYQLAGKVPVSGQDAELSALQRIVQGTQTATVYKPIPRLASRGVEIAISFAKGETVNNNAVTNNGKADIPSILLESVLVTKENILDTVVKDGYYKSEDIYKK